MEENKNIQIAPYWLWQNKLSPELCDLMNKEFQQDFYEGETFSGKNKELRDNGVRFLDLNHWFEGILVNHALWANKSANWNYDLSIASPIQLCKYGKNEHYSAHQDITMTLEENQQRKISVVCLLSDPSDFEGGEFDIPYMGEFKHLLRNRGDILAFPSFTTHVVNPVTSGIRKTAVLWMKGPAFK